MFLNRKRILYCSISLIFVFIFLLKMSISSEASLLKEEYEFYVDQKHGFSFDYPSDWKLMEENFPIYTLSIKKSDNPITYFKETEPFLDEVIYISFKENFINPQTNEIFKPEEYINREAAGIDETFQIIRENIGVSEVYIVQRKAAEASFRVLVFYIFQGDQIFRINIFPYQEFDPRESIARNIIQNLDFHSIQ